MQSLLNKLIYTKPRVDTGLGNETSIVSFSENLRAETVLAKNS